MSNLFADVGICTAGDLMFPLFHADSLHLAAQSNKQYNGPIEYTCDGAFYTEHNTYQYLQSCGTLRAQSILEYIYAKLHNARVELIAQLEPLSANDMRVRDKLAELRIKKNNNESLDDLISIMGKVSI